MKTNTLKTYGPLAIVAIACLMAYGITKTKAEEPCKTQEALSHLENVKQNQPRIAENRDARDRVASAFNSESEMNPDDVEGYNEFVRNKAWNESENDALHALGCRIDWNSLTLAPLAAEPVHASTDYDLEKLAKAVAMHETKDCGVNVGSALVNNCFGIRGWDKNGKPYFKRYATKEDSYKDFKRIWSTHYGRFPNWSLAKKYSGNDRPESWLANVTHYYETL